MSRFKFIQIELQSNKPWIVAQAIIEIDGSLYSKAKLQAQQKSLYTMNASQCGVDRTPEMKYQRQLMGSLAEIYVQEYLNELLALNNLDKHWTVVRYDDVRTDGFKSPRNEYDIKIVNKNCDQYFTVETRSSIAKDRSLASGIESFDIIGPYISVAKGNEKYNDIYIRPLYTYSHYRVEPYSPIKFEEFLRGGLISLFIVAGCFKNDMITKGYNKNMHQGSTNYRVVRIVDSNDISKFSEQLLLRINEH